jgi:hypothetical protein
MSLAMDDSFSSISFHFLAQLYVFNRLGYERKEKKKRH